MRQPTRTETLDHVAWLVAIVADHETPIERTVGFGEHVSGPFDRGTNPIRRPGDRATGVDVARPVELELADDVLPRHAARTLGIEPMALAADHHPLASHATIGPAAAGHARATTPRSARRRPRRSVGCSTGTAADRRSIAPSRRTVPARRARARPIRAAISSLRQHRGQRAEPAPAATAANGTIERSRDRLRPRRRAPRLPNPFAPRRRPRPPPPPRSSR